MSRKKTARPSIAREEMQQKKTVGEMCPFGRKTPVGGVRCHNCTFNHLEDGSCYGSKERVSEHMLRLGLDY